MSIYDIRVTKRDDFPLAIFESDLLKKALCKLKLHKNTRSDLKKLIETTCFKKVFLYLFWIFVALKFSQRFFSDIDHFSGRDKKLKDLKDNKQELYRQLEDDLKLGQERRIKFIKYWRHKF